MPISFFHKKHLLVALLCFALSLMPAEHSASEGLAVIDKVLTRSEKGGASVIIELKGNTPYKVIRILKKEILIALKDTLLSEALFSKPIAGDGLIQRIEMYNSPNNVGCLLVILSKPYTGIQHKIDTGKMILRVQISGQGGTPGVAPATVPKREAKKLDREAKKSDRPLPKKTPPPVALSRPGSMEQLLNPESMDTEPDTALFIQARDHYQMGRFDNAIRILVTIIKEYPGSRHLERAYFLRAKSFHKMFEKDIFDHLTEVIKHYQDAMSRFPESVFVPDATVSIGNCHAKAKNYYEALAYYNLAYANYKTFLAAPEALYRRGQVFAVTGKTQEAIESFHEVERNYPETQFARFSKVKRAKALYDTNSFKRSLGLLEEILDTEPDIVYESPDILLYFGYNYYELGKFGKARSVLSRTLNLYPDMESNHLVLARIADTYREQGEESKASELYNLVLREFPGSEGSLVSMFRIATNMEKVGYAALFPRIGIEEVLSYERSAVDIYKEVMEGYRDNPLSHLAELKLARKKNELKDYEGSFKTLKNILAKTSDPSLKEQIKVALRAPLEGIFEREYKAGNSGKIANYYLQIKGELEPEDIPKKLLLILGDAYRGLSLYEKAAATFESAKQFYNIYPATLLYGLGESFYKMQRFEDARSALSDFVLKYPDDRRASQAYYLVGNVMLMEKEHEKALETFQLAMQKGPDEPDQFKILVGMADVLNFKGSYYESSRALIKAVTLLEQGDTPLFPGPYEVYSKLSEVYINLGDDEQAVSTLRKALNVSPWGQDDHSLQYRLAEGYQRLKDRDKSEKILNQIIASGDPFWSKMAEAMINDMNMNEDFERLVRSWEPSPS